jgi:hypothetical protein
MEAPEVPLDFNQEGREEKDQLNGTVPPEAVQVAEYCAPAGEEPLGRLQPTVRVAAETLIVTVVELV